MRRDGDTVTRDNRQTRRNIWQAGFDAGRQQVLAGMGATYRSRMLDDLIGVLAGLLADHEAARPAGRRDASGRWMREAAAWTSSTPAPTATGT